MTSSGSLFGKHGRLFGKTAPTKLDGKSSPTKLARPAVVDPPGARHVSAYRRCAPPQQLLDMLRYQRCAGSAGEAEFVRVFLTGVAGMKQDEYGNHYLTVGGDGPRTLFSCHTDTVHWSEARWGVGGPGVRASRVEMRSVGMQKLCVEPQSEMTQKLCVDETLGVIYADDSSCLGADDTAGVWLMVNMIARGVPGLYVFHREEEIGGNGSRFFSWSSALPVTVQRAIAFDRKGDCSVITHMGDRTCSDEFAKALASQLVHLGLRNMVPDPTGIFTDTVHYVDLIPECTNVSVGYYAAHSPDEYLDYRFLAEMLEAVCAVDWDALPTVRCCNEPAPVVSGRGRLAEGLWDFGVASGSGDMRLLTDEADAYEFVLDEPEAAAEMLWDLYQDSMRGGVVSVDVPT